MGNTESDEHDENIVWKVDNENHVFKKIKGSQWVEFDNDKEIDRLQFNSKSGDRVDLRKKDGSTIRLNSNRATLLYG